MDPVPLRLSLVLDDPLLGFLPGCSIDQRRNVNLALATWDPAKSSSEDARVEFAFENSSENLGLPPIPLLARFAGWNPVVRQVSSQFVQRGSALSVETEDLSNPMRLDGIGLEPLVNHAVTIGWRSKPAALLDEGDLSTQGSLPNLLAFVFRKDPFDVEQHPTLRCVFQGTFDKENFYARSIDFLHENEKVRE